MQSRDFCYWLQGFFELSNGPDAISAEQVNLIKRHLDLVFAHELAPVMREKREDPAPTPSIQPPPPAPKVPDRPERKPARPDTGPDRVERPLPAPLC